MCTHQPLCPPADRPDRDAARTIAFRPEQGWSLLCNGVIVFEDAGELLPNGRAVPPHQLIRLNRANPVHLAELAPRCSPSRLQTTRGYLGSPHERQRPT